MEQIDVGDYVLINDPSKGIANDKIGVVVGTRNQQSRRTVDVKFFEYVGGGTLGGLCEPGHGLRFYADNAIKVKPLAEAVKDRFG